MAERQFNLVCFETLKFGAQSHTYETYRKIGGYDVWEKVLRGELTRDAIIDELKKSRPARPRRRGFPDGREDELHAAHGADAEVPRLQLRRERARHVPRPRHPAL